MSGFSFSKPATIASIAAFGAASEASVLNTSSPAKADETNNAHEAALAAKVDFIRNILTSHSPYSTVKLVSYIETKSQLMILLVESKMLSMREVRISR